MANDKDKTDAERAQCVSPNECVSPKEYAAFLIAFGADQKRWPKRALRAPLPPALGPALVDELRTLEREVKALDQVLEYGAAVPLPGSERVLADRIAAAALRMPRIAPAAHPVTTAASPQLILPLKPMPLPAAPSVAKAARPAVSSRLSQRADIGRSLAVLAASLMIGLSIGQAGWGDRTFAGLEDITGLTLTSTSREASVALTVTDDVDED